jgi:hypothetical protein
MRKLLTVVVSFAVVVTVLGWLLQGRAGAQEELSTLTVRSDDSMAQQDPQALSQLLNSPLTLMSGDSIVHIFPTVSEAAALGIPGADSGPLLYHNGPIISNLTTYAIFWLPSSGKLQNGGSTSMSAHYQTVQKNMLADYPGHGIDNNNTQYYQIVGTNTTYVHNSGSLAGSHVDTNPYPASGCTDSHTPGNCITDAQIRAEIQSVMSSQGWTGGINKIFLLFTSSGEGSCFTSSSTSCAYTQYCGYHGFLSGTTPVIFGNEPYGDTSACQIPGQPSPNSDPSADAAATVASHEVTEATTDPELNAWFTGQGNEIGDLCNYDYGTNTWDSSKANQMWNGHFYELQREFDNHVHACVQVGP